MNSLIAISIRRNNLDEYQDNRYPSIPDGELLEFENEDFSSVDFNHFYMGSSHFRNCILNNATGLYGQPVNFEKCSAIGIDFRSVSIVIKAKGSNFSDMLFDNDTNFSVQNPENKKLNFENLSVFDDCILDKKFINFAKKRNDIIMKNCKSPDVI